MKSNTLFLKKLTLFSENILSKFSRFCILFVVLFYLTGVKQNVHAQGCITSANFTPNNATCGNSNGGMGTSTSSSCTSANLIFTNFNGVTSKSCTWADITSGNSSGVITNLPPGTYTMSVACSGGSTCGKSQVITIGNTVSGGTTPVTILTDVGCGVGASNGSAQVSLSGSTAVSPYTWSNGATSSIATGLSPGTYSVSVDIGGGCTKTGSVVIPSCDPTPVADFSASSACLGISTQFTDLSTGATSWNWDFGDGTTSTAQNPSHLFGTGGSHTVKLTVKGKCGCSHTVTKVITVNSSPGPKIVCPSTVCPNASAPYTTNSICSSYNWSVTGGTIISGQNTSQILVDWGAGPMGTITLSTSGCTPPNCSTPTTVNIPILPPNPVITGPGVVCRFNTKNYSLPAFPGGVYNWSIVPSTAGTITSGQGTNAVNIQWSNPANPDAQLIATIGNPFIGCKSTATLPIRILSPFSVSGTTQVCKGSTSTVTANPVGVYSWTVSGGTVTAGQGTTTGTFSWNTAPGTYTVTATNSAGLYCNTTATAIITVVNVPPADSIAGQKKNICPGSTYAYSAWSPAGGTYSWTAVNGTIASPTTNPVNVTWGATGPYSLTVVQVLSGCNSDPITINVDPLQQTTPPITGLQTVCNNGTYTYQLPNITGATYSWTLNPATAGSVITGQGSNVTTIQFTSAGNVTINVAISLCPTPVNTTLTVLVRPAPSPTINVTGLLCTGSTLTLSSGGVFPAYEWKNSAMAVIGSNSSVNISTAGPYVLTVTDINGCTGKTVVTIEDAPKPDPSITTPDKKTYCSTETINTTLYVMVGTGYTYQWYRNGTPAGTGSSLNVTTTGSYYVVVTNAAGCIQTASTINIIQYVCSGGGGSCPNPPCFSGTTEPTDFGGNGSSWLKKVNGGSGKNTNEGVSVLSANENEDVSILTTKIFCTNTINFTDNSANTSSVQWSWDFGDGTGGSSLRNPTHTFAKAGYYLISFNVRFSNGNVGFIQKSIEIPVVPDFDAKVNCGVATFTDLSTHTATSNITSWNWNFGDASTSTVQNPVHTYATPGTYNVTLTVTAGGCTVTYNKNVVVPPFPVAQFSFPSTCAGTPIPFTDASTGTGLLFWSWNFGDGSTSQVQNPSHTYVNGGTYTVTLEVTDINGCKNTKTQSVTIAAPSGGSAITASGPTKLCAGQTVTLTSPAATSYMWSNGATTQSIVVSQSGIYSVIPFSTSTCKTLPPPVTVNVWPLPNVTLSNTTSVFCSSSSFTTTVPYNSGYSYQWYDGGGPLSGKTAFSFNTNSAGTYRVVVIDVASGCSSTSVPLTLTSLPSPSAPAIAGPASFCKRSSATLTASSTGGTGALTYSWLTGQTTTSITVSSAGFYQVQVTDQNGCSRSAGKSVTVNPLPDFSIFPAGCYTKCGKDSIFGPAGYATYQWQLNGANISTAQNIKSTISGTYKLIISTSLGCIDTSGDLNLTIAPLPVANAGPDIILCGGTAQLNGTGGGIYTWNPPTFLSSTTIPNPTSTPISTIDYELLVTDKNGCKDIDSVKVTVNPSFTVSVNQTNIICSGGTGSASTSVGSGTSPYTYTWNNGQTTATATGLTAGDYTVTVTDAKGCTSTTSSSIISPPPLTGQFTKGTANCSNCGCKEWLMVTGTGGTSPYSYSWPDGYVNRYRNQLCPGTYTVNIKDKNGCSTNLIVNAP